MTKHPFNSRTIQTMGVSSAGVVVGMLSGGISVWVGVLWLLTLAAGVVLRFVTTVPVAWNPAELVEDISADDLRRDDAASNGPKEKPNV